MKKYSNAPFKLVLAAFLMFACVYSVVLLYKDSQHRSLQWYNGGVSAVGVRANQSDESSSNYPVVTPTDNQIGTSNAHYPTYKGVNNVGIDYSPSNSDINPTVINSTTTSSTSQVSSTTGSGQSSYSSNNSSAISSSGISPLSMYSASNTEKSGGTSMGSQSLFANNTTLNSTSQTNDGRNGRMLVDGDTPPGEPGIPVGNGVWLMLAFVAIYGIFKFKQNKQAVTNN